jgi:hypothetical protein
MNKIFNFISTWTSYSWWLYLLERPRNWQRFICRIKGHPEGVRWYNVGGTEPDMRCKNCGDNLG